MSEAKRMAVVTGAGSGVGRAVVLSLAREGYDVALVGRTQKTLDETIALAGNSGAKLVAITCDISDPKQVDALVQQVRQTLGDATVLVNSAGINVARRSLAELSYADYQKVIDVNLNGAFLVSQAFLPAMRQARVGTIVHIISDAGLHANRVSGGAYIASKFGLSGLVQAINAEERMHGVRACAIYPGEINTPLLDKRPAPPPPDARQRMLQPQDVADAVMLTIRLPTRAIVEQLVIRPA